MGINPNLVVCVVKSRMIPNFVLYKSILIMQIIISKLTTCMTTVNTMDKLGRKRVIHNGVEICNNFNTRRRCIRMQCLYTHIMCTRCKSKDHNATSCQANPKVTSTSGSTTSTSNQNKKSDK